jgi:hypothetical protein
MANVVKKHSISFLVFEIADLAAQRRLRRVQPFLSRERQVALLGDRDEIAKRCRSSIAPSISPRHALQLTKSFSDALGSLDNSTPAG